MRINVYQREHLGNNLCCVRLAREQEAERGVQKYLFFIFGIYNRSAQKGSKIKPVVPLCSVKLCSKIKVTGEDNLFCRGALSWNKNSCSRRSLCAFGRWYNKMLSEFQRPKLRELSACSLACGEQRNCKNGPSLRRTMSEILLVFAFLPSRSFICRHTMRCKAACAMSCSREVTAAAVLNWNEMQIKFYRNHRNFAHVTAINILWFRHKLRTFSAGANKKYFLWNWKYWNENWFCKIRQTFTLFINEKFWNVSVSLIFRKEQELWQVMQTQFSFHYFDFNKNYILLISVKI